MLATGCGGSERVVARDDADPWTPPTADPVDLTLDTLAGQPVSLADLRGRPVLVNYFATWCVPCLAELPRLNDLVPEAEQRPAPGALAVVAVSLDGANTQKDLKAFVAATRLRFPVALADSDTLRRETPFGRLPAVPASYLLDGSGRAVERFRGVVPIGYLKRRVAALGAHRGDDVRAD